MTRTRVVRKTSFTLLTAAAIGTAPVALATATPESPSATTTSTATVVSAGQQVSGPAGSPSGIAAAVADPVAAATPAQPQAAQVSLLDLLPTPLNCLLSTGYALLCLGVPLP